MQNPLKSHAQSKNDSVKVLNEPGSTNSVAVLKGLNLLPYSHQEKKVQSLTLSVQILILDMNINIK